MSTTLADRAKGTPFASLYEQRTTPEPAARPAKPRKTRTRLWRGLKPFDNTAANFNTRIATPEESARTSRIRGRGLL